MMNWEKKGLVFNPAGKISWAKNTALQPTPIVLEDRIRIFAGFRDESGISRIGWVDVSCDDPSHVLEYSLQPVLDIGLPGTFDDNGVVPTAVIKRDNKIYLYYAGYQLPKNVRFMAFCGLAISDDNGNTFQRLKNTPILERTNDEFLFRVTHTILFEKGKWKAWYGGGSHFMTGKDKTLPVYDIRYMESEDGIHFPEKGLTVLKQKINEYRVGRPYVIKWNNKYLMFFGASSATETYRLAYAESNDGIEWQRKDELFNFHYNNLDFDSKMSAYPAVVSKNGLLYMFYNGNEYGVKGFGLAVLKNATDI